jgi:hypothetical protein
MSKSNPPQGASRRGASFFPKQALLASLMPLAKSLRPNAPSSFPDGHNKTTSPPSQEDANKEERRRWASAAWLTPAVLAFVAGGWFAATKSASPSQTRQSRAVASATVRTVEGGAHVRWHKDAIDVVVDKTFLDLAGPDVLGNAVNAWRATGATLPSVSTSPASGRQIGYDPAAANENVVVFAPYGWTKANGALAVTVVTYDDATGSIVDADLLVNGGGRFFANFDHDESSGGDPVSIENPATASSDAPATIPAQTPRFDVQSVVTHEIGHFLGLGDDQDDAMATMYARTAAGEIHKRLLTSTDATVITALYAESSPLDAQSHSGCGGAHFAAARMPTGSAWLGVGTLVAAWIAFAVFHRARSRRARVWSGWLAALGTVAALSPPDLQRNVAPLAARHDATVRIVKAEPRRVDGIVETSLTLHVTTCHVDRCPEEEQKFVVWGGKLDGTTQVVGPFAVPTLGAEVAVSLRDGRGLLKTLGPRFQP